MATTADTDEGPVEMLDAGSARPWPVRILTILLFVQAVGLFALTAYSYNPTIFEPEDPLMAVVSLLSELTRSLAFSSLGLLAFFAVLGFSWLWRTGWPTAMLVQGLSLLVSLGLYLRGVTEPYIFALMSYCILMVIYLHHPDVQQAFQTKQMQETKLEEMA